MNKPGYSKDGDFVVLRMTREDYERLLMAMGYSRGLFTDTRAFLLFVNRINEGNPSFSPYQLPERDRSAS